jgi:oxygen-dependent protoporphyrinogen oxidase
MKRVAIIGGGITGLATAHALARSSDLEVTVLEAGARLGGNIVTEHKDGFTIDGGPDSWIVTKPHATALARSVGLADRLMPTIEATRRVYVAWNGQLHPLPEGLVLAIPTKIMPIVKSGLFSWGAKLRMGLEPTIPARAYVGDEDESIGGFVTRRLGEEVTERLAAPLLGGIFAGDANELSVRATFPQFVEAEQKHGSLIRAMRAARAASHGSGGGKPPSAFMSLRGGMSELVTTVSKNIGAGRIQMNTRVTAITRLEPRDPRGRFRVSFTDRGGQRAIETDEVVLAAPSHVASAALASLDAELSASLGVFTYASTATAFLAFKREAVAHPLDAVGFIVPRALRRPILACTWISSKWEDRAPEGHVLMRVFFGGAWGESILENDDDGLCAIARTQLKELMGLDAEPLFTRVFRFTKANPQPKVGHLARVRTVREHLARWPGVHVAGSGFDGVGIPDCIRQAEIIAAAIAPSSITAEPSKAG